MKQSIIILQLLLLFHAGYATTPPSPHVRYLIVNKTAYPVSKIIQIQSDTKEFSDVDTFAVNSMINGNVLNLIIENGKDTRKFQKLIVYTRDTSFITPYFELLPEWMGYKLTILSESITLEQTSYFKISKTISDLLIALLIVFILKGIVYTLGLFRYLRRIFVELIFTNFILTALIYFSPDLWFDLRFPFFALILILSLISGFSEYLLIRRKLEEKMRTRILTISLLANTISVVTGILMMIVVRTFGGVIFYMPL
ncbi:MAG: hypothetical protein IPH20_24880 [Bacteroidales bacterium]|nr:hypothetical protein [Bacteroidales bacterium]